MPQPPANDEIAARLIALYEDAHASLLADYEAAVADPRRAGQARRLRALIRANDQILDGLVDASRTWIATALPELHAAGAAAASQVIGSSFVWTQPHIEAVQELAARTWDDVAARLQDVRTDTRKAIQSKVRDATRSALLDGKTATQAGRDLARQAASDGLFSVEYSNGARHTIRDYADSVIRTTTAEAYNGGSLTQCRADGIEQVEYADGAGCCVGPGHNVGPEANGLTVELDDVVLISHPRCRRALLPVVDAPLRPPDRSVGPPRPAGVPPTPAAARAPRTAREPRQARQLVGAR